MITGNTNNIKDITNNKSEADVLVSQVMNLHDLETNGKKSFLTSSCICSRYEKSTYYKRATVAHHDSFYQIENKI